MSYLSNSRRIRRSRSGAASSAEQRFELHGSFRHYPALLEKRARQMGLENRVAPRLRSHSIECETLVPQ